MAAEACCGVVVVMLLMTTLSHTCALVLRNPRWRIGLSSSRMRRFGGSPPRADKSPSASSNTLEWETFEFSQSPKLDTRFENDNESKTDILNASNDQLDRIAEQETREDETIAKRLNKASEMTELLSPDVVEDATRVLQDYIQPERLDRINAVLQQRTQHTRFLFENPANPSNVWACLRTLDSFGIQHVDVVLQSQKYKGKAALSQKRGMRTAMGSAQWLTLGNHASTQEAISSLKTQGYRLYASDLNSKSKDIRNVEWNKDDSKICIVMGNENDGISQEMREQADETFSVPMSGFAESFNLSVATAITLAHLSAASCNNDVGPLQPGDLDDHEVNCLRLRGIISSLAHKKLAKAVLEKEGIELPKELGWVR